MADVSGEDRKVKINKNGKVVRKRARNPEEWHKQKQKRLRIAGLEYINANGKVVPPKQPGPDCNCRRRCYQKVPEDVRLKTFKGFYSMKTHDEQNAYLFGLMRQVDVKRKRVKNSSRRTCTFEYFIRVKGRETQVCQTAFKNIHAITERKVRVLCKKMDDGVMFPSDNRGKNSHRRSGEVRLPSGVVDQIKTHVYSIVHTHRLKDFIRLDKIAGLEINVSKMWKDYIRQFDPENISATLPKSKRNTIELEIPVSEPVAIQQAPPQPIQQQESFSTAGIYPGSGHLVNIAENYFQNHYQTTTMATASTPTNFYQTPNGGQSMGILLQSPGRAIQPATYIVLQQHPTKPDTTILEHHTKQEPTQIAVNTVTINNQTTINHATFTQPTTIIQHQLEIEQPKIKKIKKERKKGPLVKQWRYTNIFQNEINGAALAAIKTRLSMYYAESDAARKKVKQARLQESAPVAVTAQPVQVQPEQQIRPTHTVTIYT